jgi:cytochrome b subunit of formate dehydrogenase
MGSSLFFAIFANSFMRKQVKELFIMKNTILLAVSMVILAIAGMLIWLAFVTHPYVSAGVAFMITLIVSLYYSNAEES